MIFPHVPELKAGMLGTRLWLCHLELHWLSRVTDARAVVSACSAFPQCRAVKAPFPPSHWAQTYCSGLEIKADLLPPYKHIFAHFNGNTRRVAVWWGHASV